MAHVKQPAPPPRLPILYRPYSKDNPSRRIPSRRIPYTANVNIPAKPHLRPPQTLAMNSTPPAESAESASLHLPACICARIRRVGQPHRHHHLGPRSPAPPPWTKIPGTTTLDQDPRHHHLGPGSPAPPPWTRIPGTTTLDQDPRHHHLGPGSPGATSPAPCWHDVT